MSAPVFEDVEPPPGCGCEGCARQRLGEAAARAGGGPAAPAARVAVLAAVAGTALGATATATATAVAAAPLPAADRGVPAGRAQAADLPGGAATAPLKLTRSQILERAESWVTAKVPYSMTSSWKDGYRQDCSGYVSMAWGLNTNAWTGNLADYGVRVTKAQLQPGDILLFHNAADPSSGSHTVVFGGWVDDGHTEYTGYEQTKPATRVRTTPYAYWSNSSKYLPYRYKNLVGAADPAPPAGSSDGGPADAAATGSSPTGSSTTGPASGPATAPAAGAADPVPAAGGSPSHTTGRAAVGHLGRQGGLPRTSRGPAAGAPPYPGAGVFRPGHRDDAVLALGRRLVAKGFGGYYRSGPNRTWSKADRRNVAAFQRAQGWSGRDADGVPGPGTWRRLFS